MLLFVAAQCFAEAGCRNGLIKDQSEQSEDSSSSDGSESPTVTPEPTPIPKDTLIPTQSPLERGEFHKCHLVVHHRDPSMQFNVMLPLLRMWPAYRRPSPHLLLRDQLGNYLSLLVCLLPRQLRRIHPFVRVAS